MLKTRMLQISAQSKNYSTNTRCWIVSLGVSMILITGCTSEKAPEAPPLLQVETITVTEQTVPDEPEFIGRTEAFRPVEIRSQVSGIIKKVYFTEGRNVNKGDKLYLIDPTPFNAAYQAAKATVAQQQARLIQVRQNLARVKPLLEEQAVSQKDVDDAVADVLSAEAALDAAKNDLVKAKFDFDNTVIIAPVKGRIGRSSFYEGQLISAQTTLLNTIDQLDPMYVSINVPESYILRRRKELTEKKVERPDIYQLKGIMTFADGSVYPEEGTLDFASVQIRAETGTLQGRFKFPNPTGSHSPGELDFLPGQFVSIRLKGYMRPNAILIPQRAIQHGANGSFVYIVDNNNKIELRPVSASMWYNKDWLIENGVKPGEKIVVAGFHLVQPGMQVTTIPSSTSENQVAP